MSHMIARAAGVDYAHVNVFFFFFFFFFFGAAGVFLHHMSY